MTESLRMEAQRRLDASRSGPERNRLGQFATPPALAQEIVEQALSFLPARAKVRFMDPAFGTGAFYSALLQAWPSSGIAGAAGIEIDADVLQEAKRVWRGADLHLTIGDFTQLPPPDDDLKPNLLICNPPYVRHHHLGAEQKTRLKAAVYRELGLSLDGLAGLYSYFLLLCDNWMAPDALAVWLIPSEFMDVNYGATIKQYLRERVSLLRIHRFNPESVQFDDALVTSAVVMFRNCPPANDCTVEFTYGGSLTQPSDRQTMKVDALADLSKWSALPGELAASLYTSEASPRLRDFFTIRRGIATGDNSFFVLDERQVIQNKIPACFLKPLLPSPKNLLANEILADKDGAPVLTPKRYLLDCGLSEKAVEVEYPDLWAYLQNGKSKRNNERYLSRHRKPWYSQEQRPAAPFLCTYMGRAVDGGNPFRFILNHSNATALNVYLLLYPKPQLAGALHDDEELKKVVWAALGEIGQNVLVQHGRVYGGGLHKLEPRELANAPATTIINAHPALAKSLVTQPTLL